MNRRSAAVLALILWVGSLAPLAHGQPGGTVLFHQAPAAAASRPESMLVIGQIAGAPVIDGRVDPVEWAAATRTSFTFAGDSALTTSVYLGHDATNLYLAFDNLEPRIGEISSLYGPGKSGPYAPNAKGDSDCYNDDAIEIWIATDATQTQIYQFISNAIGGRMDVQYTGKNHDFDAGYTSGFVTAGSVSNDRWSIEFAIPLKALGIEKVEPGTTAMRINFGRDRRVTGNQNVGWQSFWAWDGAMPQAVLGPAMPVAIEAIDFGKRLLGDNTVTFRLRSIGRSSKGISATVGVGEGKSTPADLIVTDVNSGVVEARAAYNVASAEAPFDLHLRIDDGNQPFVLTEKQMRVTPPLASRVERYRYGPADGPNVAFAEIQLNPASLGQYRLQASLGSLPPVVAEIKSTAAEVRWTMADAPAGDHELRLALLDSDGKAVFEHSAGVIHWTGSAPVSTAASAAVELKLDVFNNLANPAGSWPVLVGVPFAKGALASAAHVRLVGPDGAEVAAEFTAVATWDRGASSVKWLHVKTMADLAHAGKAYKLEYGPGVSRAAAASPLRAGQTDEAVTIDTGVLKLVCARKPFRFIESAWLDRNGDHQYSDDEQIVVPGPNSALVTQTQDGRRYSSANAVDWPEMERVELEHAGPMEAVIRAEGWHTALTTPGQPQGGRMLKYVVRIIVYPNSAAVRVFHTFIHTEDESVQYREISLGLSLRDEDTAVRGEQSREPTPLTAGAEAALLQIDHDAYRLQLRKPENGPSLVCVESGNQSAGWLLVQRKDWGVTLATRDFWQNYVKGYEVRRDGISLCPHPRDSETPLSFRPEDVLAPVFVRKLAYHSDGGIFPTHGNYTTFSYGVGTKPIGVSKTHEFMLDFTAAPSPERSVTVQRLLNDPPLLIVPPEYACGTEVLGKIHPYDAETFGVEEKAFHAMLKRTEYGKPEDRHYGWCNFGDSYQASDHTGRITVYRTYQNTGYGIVGDFHRGYFRTGQRDWYRYAVRRIRHHRDLDTCHFGPMAGGTTEYDTMHWCNGAIVTFWTHRLGLMLDWYMTGDRRTFDTLNVACEAMAQLPVSTGPRDERHWFNQPKEFVLLYQFNWDERLLERAQAVWEGILLSKANTGEAWPVGNKVYPEYLQPALIMYHQFTQDPRVIDYLSRWFSDIDGIQNYATGRGQDTAAYLYWATGDAKWIDLVGGQETMRDYMRLYDVQKPPPAGGMRYYTVNEFVNAYKTHVQRYKIVQVDGFMDKGFHHTFERFWYFMAAVKDAKGKGILKPYDGPKNTFTGPVWNEEYWKTVTPEQAKEYGWKP